jgi:hypothetical protein
MGKKMRMKWDDVIRRLNMLDRRGYRCIICGRGFSSLASVTYEHVIPRSRRQGQSNKGNIAPSHFNCNQLRGTMGLGDAWREVEKLRKRIGEAQFQSWIDVVVPNRIVPEIAMLPPELIRILFKKHDLKRPANDTKLVADCTVDAGEALAWAVQS